MEGSIPCLRLGWTLSPSLDCRKARWSNWRWLLPSADGVQLGVMGCGSTTCSLLRAGASCPGAHGPGGRLRLRWVLFNPRNFPYLLFVASPSGGVSWCFMKVASIMEQGVLRGPS